MQDLNDKVDGGSLGAAEWNQVPSEIQNVIEGLGQTLSGGDLNQLGKAIAGYVANGDFYTDSGIANAYVLSPIGLKQSPPAIADGMRIRFYAGNTNTGASTVNPGGLGVTGLRNSDDTALVAGSIVAGKLYEAVYSSSAGWFRLQSNASTSAIGGFTNLTGSTTGTTATITMAADSVIVFDPSNNAQKLTSVSLSINSAASGANGLDTGTLAASTWYYIFVIWNGTTTAGLISLSATSPTLPSGYTHFARIATTRTDASGNKFPLSMTWDDKYAEYKVAAGSNVPALPTVVSGVQGNIITPTWVSASISNFIPPVSSTIHLVLVKDYATSSTSMAAPSNSYGGVTSTTNPPPIIAYNAANTPGVANGYMQLESTNIYYAGNNVNCMVQAAGWRE